MLSTYTFKKFNSIVTFSSEVTEVTFNKKQTQVLPRYVYKFI